MRDIIKPRYDHTHEETIAAFNEYKTLWTALDICEEFADPYHFHQSDVDAYLGMKTRSNEFYIAASYINPLVIEFNCCDFQYMPDFNVQAPDEHAAEIRERGEEADYKLWLYAI